MGFSIKYRFIIFPSKTFIEFVTLHSNSYCVGMVFVTSTSLLKSGYVGGGSHVSVVVLPT